MPIEKLIVLFRVCYLNIVNTMATITITNYFDASKLNASMATGGLDCVCDVIPTKLWLIFIMQLRKFSHDHGHNLDSMIDSPVYFYSLIMKECATKYNSLGHFLNDVINNDIVELYHELIEPASWAFFVQSVREEKRFTEEWWALPRREMPESIRHFRAKHDLETPDDLMDRIMKWVDVKLMFDVKR